jgi:iron complex outermembrane receptor protein
MGGLFGSQYQWPARWISVSLIKQSSREPFRDGARGRCLGRKLIALGLVAGALFGPSPAALSATDSPRPDLAELSLEELTNIVITSVSKRAERLSDAPASVFVITADDIRRSGYTSLPEVLRLAPNLQVARVSAGNYAITARGFNGNAANKLLVLIDGRSVYSPLFSGVFWDVQDVVLEDIDRIEIISGPGSTLWGTNAVNGVINIITKSAKDTQGGLFAAGNGNREADGTLRYGTKLGDEGNIRLYAKGFDRDHTSTANGTPLDDAMHRGQAGFRADWQRAGDQFTVQGDAYEGRDGQPIPGNISFTGVNLALGSIPLNGANLISRWVHGLDDGASVSLQAYYDLTERTVPPTYGERLDIVDVEFQHTLRPLGINNLTWGGEYRYAMDRVINSTNYIAFLPANVDQSWTSLFAQDEIAMRDDLRLTLGARVERNPYTGSEFLPNARLAWKLAPDHLLWGALSRTVRAPSRLDADTFAPATPPSLLAGGPGFRSETADVAELGYRGQPSPGFTYSVTAYYSLYDRLHTLDLAPSHTQFIYGNDAEGRTRGVEMWGAYQVSGIWRLTGGWSGLQERLALLPGGNFDTTTVPAEGQNPSNTWMLRSALNLPYHIEFDMAVRRVSTLSDPIVPAYTAVDARIGWTPRRNLELSISGQNLVGPAHGEFTDIATRSAFGHSVFFKILARY